MAMLAQLPRWSIEVVRTVVILAIVLAVGTVYQARGDNHDTTYHACLYAGSLSQVSTNPPSNCGRGAPISWVSGGQPGLNQAYDASEEGNDTIVYGAVEEDPMTELQILSVPAGSYVVTATIELHNGSAAEEPRMYCEIEGEVREARNVFTMGPQNDNNEQMVVPMQAIVSLSVAGDIVLGCVTIDDTQTAGDPSTVSALRASLIAIPVEQVN